MVSLEKFKGFIWDKFSVSKEVKIHLWKAKGLHVVGFKVGTCGFALENDHMRKNLSGDVHIYQLDLLRLTLHRFPKELYLVWKKGASLLSSVVN